MMSYQGNGIGIAAFGNYIIDKIRQTPRDAAAADYLKHGFRPPVLTEGRLTLVSDVDMGTGGGAYSTLKDLAKLDPKLPRAAIGKVGNDADGLFIFEDLAAHGIDASGMERTERAGTSFTDVYQPAGGDRSFGHYQGANALLDFDHIAANMPLIQRHRICYGGYAQLLKALDAPNDQYGTEMARALKMISDGGVKTALAVVAMKNPSEFPLIVGPSLRYTNFFMHNGYEAGCTVWGDSEHEVTKEGAEEAAKRLFGDFGVRELVVIHMGEEGSFGMLSDGTSHYQPAHFIAPESVVGTVGAGDAFEAGVLHGMHERKDLGESMRLGTAMAAICLGGRTATDSMLNMEQTLDFMARTPYIG